MLAPFDPFWPVWTIGVEWVERGRLVEWGRVRVWFEGKVLNSKKECDTYKGALLKGKFGFKRRVWLFVFNCLCVNIYFVFFPGVILARSLCKSTETTQLQPPQQCHITVRKRQHKREPWTVWTPLDPLYGLDLTQPIRPRRERKFCQEIQNEMENT